MTDRRKSQRALRACGEWLVECLRGGWKREQLDALESLWWEYHDDNGNLIGRQQTPRSDSESQKESTNHEFRCA